METVFKNARIHTMTRTAGPARAGFRLRFGRFLQRPVVDSDRHCPVGMPGLQPRGGSR